MVGQDVNCPHCGRETTLLLPQIRKVISNQNNRKSSGTKALFGIIGIAIVATIIFIHQQSKLDEAAINFREATDPTKQNFWGCPR